MGKVIYVVTSNSIKKKNKKIRKEYLSYDEKNNVVYFDKEVTNNTILFYGGLEDAKSTFIECFQNDAIAIMINAERNKNVKRRYEPIFAFRKLSAYNISDDRIEVDLSNELITN